MNAAPDLRLPSDLVATMAGLVRAGFELLPLGRGADGKAPLLGFDGQTVTLRQALGAMGARRSTVYGIRLPRHVVLDLDERDDALLAHMEARFGAASVVIASGRGWHLWFRAPPGPLPRMSLRAEGLPVDVKTGPNALAVGPGSTRPDGVTYRYERGDLTRDPLTALRLPVASPLPAPSAARTARADRVPVGSRHRALIAAGRDLVRAATSAEDLTMMLTDHVQARFQAPGSIPAVEIQGVADWCWRCRVENRVFGGRDSALTINRRAVDALKGRPAQDEALGLYCLLIANHGHVPGVRFPLKWEAMQRAGLTAMSRRVFRTARLALEAGGLLRVAAKAVPGKSPQLYQLCIPLKGEEGG